MTQFWLFLCSFSKLPSIALFKKLISLQNFAANFLLFCFFQLLKTQKTLKIKISTSVWSLQHPNAGWNIQPKLQKVWELKTLLLGGVDGLNSHSISCGSHDCKKLTLSTSSPIWHSYKPKKISSTFKWRIQNFRRKRCKTRWAIVHWN